jgi:hypothetical protein
MDSTEKAALVLKFFESLSTTDNSSSEKKETEQYISEPTEYIDKLRKRAKDLSQTTELKIGDIVIWKDGLKNKRFPRYKQPAIVLKIIDPIIKDNDPSYNETLNVKLGFITSDDEFISFNYDSDRFKLIDTRII